MLPMEGKIAIVTGAGKGIGREICLLFAEKGAKIVAAARTQSDIEELVGQIESQGGEALAVATDIRRRDEADRLISSALDRFGGIDVLVNNAGVGAFANVVDLSDADWNSQIETNLTGMFFCTRAALKEMLKGKKDTVRHIINIASLASTAGFRGGSAYCASKFGVVGFTESLMLEVREHNIKVSVILPGSVNTSFRGTSPDAESWKLHPGDIAQAVVDVVTSSKQALMSRIEVRPLKPKG
ncbi:MAG: SDR family oxidoreductase [Gemmatimonadota bacterium]|nr:MAG: SDR family oxidoreductase [Gemmatimonadota bacterium]